MTDDIFIIVEGEHFSEKVSIVIYSYLLNNK